MQYPVSSDLELVYDACIEDEEEIKGRKSGVKARPTPTSSKALFLVLSTSRPLLYVLYWRTTARIRAASVQRHRLSTLAQHAKPKPWLRKAPRWLEYLNPAKVFRVCEPTPVIIGTPITPVSSTYSALLSPIWHSLPSYFSKRLMLPFPLLPVADLSPPRRLNT